jgi:DNA-binding MarR family transcriptional regulator
MKRKILPPQRAALGQVVLDVDRGPKLSLAAVAALGFCCQTKPPTTMRELAKLLNIHASQASRAAIMLTEAGLLERHVGPTDGRLTKLRPTNAGRDLDAKITRASVALASAENAKAA